MAPEGGGFDLGGGGWAIMPMQECNKLPKLFFKLSLLSLLHLMGKLWW
jgi:hypothetical protein